MNVEQLTKAWCDEPEAHRALNETCTTLTNADPMLKAHRDWVEKNIWGFGERSFCWMWKAIVDEMPTGFSFMEVGVFRGQVLSLIGALAQRTGKACLRYGVTPLTNAEIGWESDYAADIHKIHETFYIPDNYEIIKGFSDRPETIGKVLFSVPPLDILYIDGGHTYEVVKSDLSNYSTLVKPGGYLVMDDSGNRFKQPEGFFAGIESVSRAADEVLPPFGAGLPFDFLFNVMHNRVWKRKPYR